MDIQERLTAFAMLGASWVMWLLVGLSIIGLAIILERAYYLLSARDDVQTLRLELLRLYKDKDVEGVKKRLSSSKAFEAQIVGGAIDELPNGPESLEERLSAETRLTKQRMERNLAFLGTVGNNAPFVGLLGTVIGIIRAFAALNESQGQVTSGLMAEVGEALVATAIGLLVALPSVAFFNYFQRLIKTRLDWAAAMGSDLLAFAKRSDGKAG
ncbi:MAG: MotA/TolQ/ExbB proton channel family protein [Polyangiales bacterium]